MRSVLACLLLAGLTASSAQAQTFLSYSCADGTPVAAASFTSEQRLRIQLDGKALTLPKRLAPFGTRYARAGVSFWMRGDVATLKRPKKKATVSRRQS